MVSELENIFEIASSLPHRERIGVHTKKRKIIFFTLREETKKCFQLLNKKPLCKRSSYLE
jgi:hypothetical protein